MTAIVGVEFEWGCEIAADSLTTGPENQRCSGPGMEKLVRRGSFILGAAGMGNFCETLLTFEPPRAARADGIDFMRRVFIPALRDHFDEFDLPLENRTQDTYWEGIAALNGRVYLLDDAGGVSVPAGGVVGLGAAGAYAAGAVMAGATPRKAILIAAQLDVTAGPPAISLKQKLPVFRPS